MRDLEAAYEAAWEAYNRTVFTGREFIPSIADAVDAALATLADGGNLYVRKGSDGETRTSQYVKVWPNE